MTIKHRKAAAAVLHRAGLLGAVLAIVAGILGMHVMTGTQSRHALTAAALTGASTTELPVAHEHTAHAAASSALAAPVSELRDGGGGATDKCSCGDSCAATHNMTMSCTPLAQTESLTVPLPGTAIFGVLPDARASGEVSELYTYLPGGPSPGELSISRT